MNNLQLLENWFKEKKFISLGQLANSSDLKSQSEKKALHLFHQSAKKIPAYQDFLTKHKFNPQTVKTITDFSKIPTTTKQNYIDKYPMSKRCWQDQTNKMHMISTSSGTTGTPHFWPRNLKAEIDGALAHEIIFNTVCQINNKNTLLINGFAMGNWIAGTFTLACINLLAWKGYPITIMTPGYNSQEILDILKNISRSFDKIIITGHTPFLKEVIEQGSASGINWLKLDVTFLGTGQGISENWREYIIGLITTKNPYAFINLYGSADAALMGFETQNSIDLRKFLNQNMNISKQIFNDERLPSIYNYDPRLTFFESVKGELVITKDSGCPLIRYNIQDQGGIFDDIQMTKISKNMPLKSTLKLPFVYLFGREKFMVKIYGANIYTEHVQAALNHLNLQRHITGKFILEIIEDKNKNQLLVCHVELAREIVKSSQLTKLVQKIFIEQVSKLNSEYNFLLGNMKKKVYPRIILYENAHKKYFNAEQIKKTS